MAEILPQGQRNGDSWNGGSSRAAGLYGELPLLPLPAAAPVLSARTRKPRARPGSTD